MKKIIFILLCLTVYNLGAQQGNKWLKGIIYEKDRDYLLPIQGAYVYWLNSKKFAITNAKGEFLIDRSNDNDTLLVSYVGYNSEKIVVDDTDSVVVVLSSLKEISEVEVLYRSQAIKILPNEPIKIEHISEKELLKGACCNLSESFETNPSVDVSFSDAITGLRQIQLLGLASSYTQITRENMLDVYGLNNAYGLLFTPGPFIESIRLNKGVGSVINGYESIAGQIDVQLKEPENMNTLFFNGYINSDIKIDANTLIGIPIHEHLKSGLFLHMSRNTHELDINKDGFMDMPLSEQFNGLFKTSYFSDHGWHIENSTALIFFENQGGQLSKLNDNTFVWRMNSNVKKWNNNLKIGKTNLNNHNQSIALQLAVNYINQNMQYGLRPYNGIQQSFYANLIYMDNLFNADNKIKLGVSFRYQDIKEAFEINKYFFNEKVSGLFSEYTYSHDNITIVVGSRIDYNNLYSWIFTPRLHAKYSITDHSTIRATVGKGTKTSYVFSENLAMLASSRTINIVLEDANLPYGLLPDKAWNYGLNFTHQFYILEKNNLFTIDLYRTDFENQVLVDYDANPQEVRIYNVVSGSFSNAIQTMLEIEPLFNLRVRVAYRWFDAQNNYINGKMQRPLFSKHRAFINFEYNLINRWKFDWSTNWQGPKRLPSTISNPPMYQLNEYSSSFSITNVQVTKIFKNKFEVYGGVENLFNFTQKNAIIAYDNPLSPYFDASLIWGPLTGRMWYVGFRYSY